MEKVYKRVSDAAITLTELMLPSHSNFSGKIHGGYIMSLMDQIAFACASKHSQKYCVTAAVERVDFLNPIDVGELVTLKASINYVGNTSMVVGIRVEAENILEGSCKHCNSSYFTMVAKDKNGKNAQVPGLILESKEEVRRYVTAILRMQEKKHQHPAFDEKTFEMADYAFLLRDKPINLQLGEGENLEI
ncbi:MAG: acyl-CoA thioesterase [Flavobacteriaceae bacterium]|nr:acyl-CoA thioesterase [Flavobacteriaceae bacterium]